MNDVLQLAELYASSDTAASDASQSGGQPAAQQQVDQQTVFALDKLQAKLDDAKAAVTKASEAYQAAQAKAEGLQAQVQAATDQANAQALLSDRLDAQTVVAQLGVDADAAAGEANRLKSELDAAQDKLASLQEQAKAASFNRPARQLLSAAPSPSSASSTYVFPVGGGPSVVSVSHTHHDYPAADIAAPEGSPLYALADGSVLYAWPDDARCGTGFTMQTTDGQVWTYCHLSYMYPEVQPGAQLAAGRPVGLVGHTGHATGPHLHLQLQPAESYPQDQAWFKAYAGTAFQWSDATSTKAGSPGIGKITFSIVQQASD